MAEPAARLYYIQATARFGWSRSTLLNQIKAGAYEHALLEKKTHNFPLALPEHLAGQAEEALKSSYSLGSLGVRREIKERELESRLIERLREFILEPSSRLNLKANSPRPGSCCPLSAPSCRRKNLLEENQQGEVGISQSGTGKYEPASGAKRGWFSYAGINRMMQFFKPFLKRQLCRHCRHN